jgi:acyl-CoA thioesterase-1
MTQSYKVTVALLGLFLSLFTSATASAAEKPPRVIFLGDYLTYAWTSGFAANKNWINASLPGMNYPGQTSSDVAARFQADVVALHPAIVHILIGSVDAAIADDATGPTVVANFIANIEKMVQEAKAADIKVILATTPAGSLSNFGIVQMNAFLESYGAANDISVINYDDMLCGCVSSVGGSGIGFVYDPSQTNSIPLMDPSLIPSAAGYARMTQMAEAVVDSLSGVKLKSGWLNNVEATNSDIGVSKVLANVNQVFTSAVLQFTPWGLYSNGVTRALYNSNFAGSSGAWTSSNPYGVPFSEWIMTVHESE